MTTCRWNSEDLTITPERVVVRYRFVNHNPKPVTLTVGFPLPDIDLADPDVDYAFPVGDPVNFVGFKTLIDGRPVAFQVDQQAMLGGKDVSGEVRAAGLALLSIGGLADKVSTLSPQVRSKLIKDGLLTAAGTDENDQPIYAPAWTVKTLVVRRQTFPPDRAVVVEHRYRTSLGMSFDTVLRKAVRESPGMQAQFKRYVAEYCVPDSLLRGIDRIAGDAAENTAKLREWRIRYVLKTGANWAGPIKHFHLVVDKGDPKRLVSFCADNVRTTSPTTFEVRATDFTPTHDLNILLVGSAK